MHIAVDCDDVMLDFFSNVLDCFEREFGERPEYDGRPWGPSAVAFTKHPALLAAGYKSWWDWLRERDWLWGIAPAIPGAIGGVKTLRAAGHYMELVTSKPEWAEPQVWRWLGKWRPAFERVTITKPGVPKHVSTEAQLIIDDKLQTCEEFRDVGRQAILFDRAPASYEHRLRKYEAYPGILVAHSWADVVAGVSDLA